MPNAKSKSDTGALVKSANDMLANRNEAATAALLKLGEDLFLTDSDVAEIQGKFSTEKFIAPWKLRGVLNIPDDQPVELFLQLESVENFELSNGKTVPMVVASAVKNPLTRLRFVESAGMRGNFKPERVGKKFVLTHTGEIKTNKPMPCQTYSFSWEM